MPITEKKYPDWVQKYRTQGKTVKKKGDAYYLYKRTSKRVPGKKYPQPVDTYIGIITPEGIIESSKKKISITDIEVWEYGFTKAVMDLCPDGWKKPLGDDWEDVLRIIICDWSERSWLKKEGIRDKNDLGKGYFKDRIRSTDSNRQPGAEDGGVREPDFLSRQSTKR